MASEHGTISRGAIMKRVGRKTDRIGIRLTPEDREALEQLAGPRSLSETLRDVLVHAIRRREEDQVREAIAHAIKQGREAVRAELAQVRQLVDDVTDTLTAIRGMVSELAGAIEGLTRLAADAATHARIAAASTQALALRQLQGMGIRDVYESEVRQAVQQAERAVTQLLVTKRA
jgi:hypothetical protein